MTTHHLRLAGASASAFAPMTGIGGYLESLAADFVNHASVTWRGEVLCLDAGFAWAELHAGAKGLHINLAALNPAALDNARDALLAHIDAVSPELARAFTWSDMDRKSGSPILFRRMHVMALRNITPRMRRIRLGGEDLGRFANGGLHVRMVFPAQDTGHLPSPRQDGDGRLIWPSALPKPVSRVYTLRHVDAAAGWLEIDMLLHPEASGPGSEWAMSARVGAEVGIMGPRGAMLPAAARYLFLGDETALPAIARHLDALPAQAAATVLATVADGHEEQALHSPAELSLRWLHRGGPGLVEALAEEPALLDGGESFVWAGCERSVTEALRKLLRAAGHPAAASHLTAYWQREHAQPE